MEGRGSGGFYGFRVYGLVHRLGKEARWELVRVALGCVGGVRELAERLGVSRQAVRKYLSGRMHPRDEVVLRVLSIVAGCGPAARRAALRILRREVDRVLRGYEAALRILGVEDDVEGSGGVVG